MKQLAEAEPSNQIVLWHSNRSTTGIQIIKFANKCAAHPWMIAAIMNVLNECFLQFVKLEKYLL